VILHVISGEEASQSQKGKRRKNRNANDSGVGIVGEDDDDDGGFIPTVDPITKGPIKRAMRNLICDHIYDQDSILQNIKENKHARYYEYDCKNISILNCYVYLSNSNQIFQVPLHGMCQ